MYVQKGKLMQIASIDTGNAEYKGVHLDATEAHDAPIAHAFPNAWARPKEGDLDQWEGLGAGKKRMIVSLNGGERIAVGESAFALSRYQHERAGYARYTDTHYPTMVAGLLAKLFPDGEEIALTMSLPVDGFGQAAGQKARLQGEWLVEYDNGGGSREIRYFIRPAHVVPEAFGSLCYFILSYDGQAFVDEQLAEGRVAVIDIGGYTTDILTFDALDMGGVYGSVERGIIEVRGDINTAIKRQFQRSDLTTPQIDRIMTPVEDGRYIYTHAGVAHDVTEMVESALWTLTDGVLDIWHNRLEAGVDYDAIILTGGGSVPVGPSLLPKLEHGRILRPPEEHAKLANAIGALSYALHVNI